MRGHSNSSTAVFASLLVAVGACADILDVPSSPALTARGPWHCLENPVEPDPPERDKATIQVQACDFVSTNCNMPVTNLTAKLCDKRDVNCANPIRTDIRDTGGLLTAEVPTGGALGSGFDGYLQVNSPTERCDNEMVFGPSGKLLCELARAQGCNPESPDDRCRMPIYASAMMFFNPPVRTDQPRPTPLPLVPTTAIQPILEAVGGTEVDPSTGFLFITALNCDGVPAAGVTFRMIQNQNAVTQLYIDNGVVSKTAFQTDESGLAGFVHVPAGFAGVVGSTSGDAESAPREIGELGVQVAPFTITYGTLAPTN